MDEEEFSSCWVGVQCGRTAVVGQITLTPNFEGPLCGTPEVL